MEGARGEASLNEAHVTFGTSLPDVSVLRYTRNLSPLPSLDCVVVCLGHPLASMFDLPRPSDALPPGGKTSKTQASLAAVRPTT